VAGWGTNVFSAHSLLVNGPPQARCVALRYEVLDLLDGPIGGLARSR
jgi:hypothetical protein